VICGIFHNPKYYGEIGIVGVILGLAREHWELFSGPLSFVKFVDGLA